MRQDIDEAASFLSSAQQLETLVRTARWKYVHFERFRPQLFDLEADPHELHDLGDSAAHGEVREAMKARLFSWALTRKTRTTVTHDYIQRVTGGARARGYRFGEW